MMSSSSAGISCLRRGAFVDKKGVRWDTNESDFEGWLTKKSKLDFVYQTIQAKICSQAMIAFKYVDRLYNILK